MENNKTKILIGLILFIIVLLAVVVVMFATNTISFNKNKVVNQIGSDNTSNQMYSSIKFDTSKLLVKEVDDKDQKAEYLGDIRHSNIATYCIDNTGNIEYFSMYNVNCKIEGLSGAVQDICAGEYVDGSSGYAIFLMSDGTVEKSSELFSSCKTGVITSSGKIKNLVNIVKVIQSHVKLEFSDGHTINKITFIAIDKNGNAYDLFVR